jgi:OmcA/MtrC family decaheme c-type cytochrome
MNVSSSWGTRILGCVWALLAVAILAGCSGGKDGAAGPAGPTGPQGPGGSTGPSGPVLALDISTAKTITAKVTGVTSGASPVITFTLVDQTGTPLKGLQASQVSFAIAQLQVAADGSTNWRNYITRVESPGGIGWGTADAVQPNTQSGAAGTFVDKGDGSYTFAFSAPLDTLAGTAQAAYNVAGRIPTGITIAYDGTLTHRIGLEIRGTGLNPTNNAVYDYIPETGSTTLTVTRKIASNKECDACHAKLAMHGGPRIDVEYCVLCHNNGNADAQSGNSLDLKVLTHKIHTGAKLPSVVADTTNHGLVPAKGIGYVIYGFGGSVNNFNDVVWPQDTRNCTTCHNTADANTTEANHYSTVATAAACGACHDDIDFTATTVVKHTGVTGPIADSTCMNAGCHNATTPGTAAVGGGNVDTVTAHAIAKQNLTAKYKLQIFRVEAVTAGAAASPNTDTVETACAAKLAAVSATTSVICAVPPGYWPRVTIRIVDPTNNNAPYALNTAPFNTAGTSISARVGWSTLNYTNPGAIVGVGATQAETVSFLKNAAASPYSANPAPATTATNVTTVGSSSISVIPAVPAAYFYNSDPTQLTARLPYPVPVATSMVGNSGAVSAQAQLNIPGVADVGTTTPVVSGTSNTVFALPVPIRAADPAYFPITGTTAVARRQVVDYNNCLRCHKKLVAHGSRTDNVQFCVMCHNPAQAPYRPSANTAAGVPAFSYGSEPVDFKFFIHGLHSAQYKIGELDFTEVGFPGQLGNCLGCHKTDTYYPVDPAKVYATSIDNAAGGQPYSLTPLTGSDDPRNHYAISANAAACGSCHTDALAQTHMKQQGSVVVGDLVDNSALPAANVGMLGMGFQHPNTYKAGAPKIKAADGSTLPQYQTETCSVCHGPGATADVKVVHGVASYKYN